MAHWEVHYDVTVEVEYLPGTSNEAADRLSRWRKKGLDGFTPEQECKISLVELLEGCVRVPM